MTGFRRQCLVQEGFGRLDDAQLAQLDLPLRFSPALCLGLMVIGIATRNPVVFGLLAALAAIGAITRRHPFDLVWEYLVRPVVGGAHLPAAPCPRRFAFVVATPVLTAATLSLALGREALGLSLAALQVAGCAAYVFAGWCGASLVHQKLLRRTAAPQASAA
ncbi:MAG: DUF4395 domain-containing protein [Actinomycetota bacterium]|nr:DUF4395 domain-containing protein [Actinomycetota bacterium]